jgi:ABC-type antimicrobial peptide transport system permease subunit
MKHFSFFLRQALASFVHNRQRTLFVLFCIAVGVASVVSLRTVGLMIGDGLTQDLQSDNRADIVVSTPVTDERFSDRSYDETLVEEGGEVRRARFSESGLERIEAWSAENGVRMQKSIRHLQPLPIYPVKEGGPQSASGLAFFVEPESYPFYGEARAIEPAGMTIEQALSMPGGIAISERMAETLLVSVGDELQVRGPEPFEIRAILPNELEARMREMEAVVLPWALLSYDDGESVFELRADTLYLAISPDQKVTDIEEAFKEAFEGTRLRTTDALLEDNEEVSSVFTRLITTLGLVSLLIGGIGIANTMLVVVGRRTLEIGVLKTVGLRGRQITIMFLIEALILGVVGSVVGLAMGLGMVALLRGAAESMVAETLAFTIYPEALVMGLVTGVLVTLVFGFLPTLAAGRVRPNVVLQPDQQVPPKAGLLRSLGVMVVLTAIIGLMVGQIIEKPMIGMGATYAAVAALGIIMWIFRLVVVLFGKLPSLGSTYLKLTQRAISSHPGRAASTLLALVVGMFALSSILLMTESLLNVIEDVMEEELGGDVMVVPNSPEASERAAQRLAELEGIEAVHNQLVWNAKIVAINGDTDIEALEKAAYDLGEAERKKKKDEKPEKEEAEAEGEGEGDREEGFDRTRFILKDLLGETTISLAGDEMLDYTVEEGVDVQPDDGLWIVLRQNDATEWMGLEVGSELTIRYDGDEERTVSVAGVMAKPEDDNFSINVGVNTRIVASRDVVPEGLTPMPTVYIVDVDDELMADTMRSLSEDKGLFVLPVALVNQMLTGIFEKITALPMVIALLALFAGGVIIANTVSLAVLERRRQIGIMKAIGLHSSQVLGLLMLEGGMVGLLGGVIGTGIGVGMILFMGVVSESPGSFPVLTLIGLIALSAGIALAATLLTAWEASREKPLIVLRYE